MLILGPHGIEAATAAGVLLTATGALGGLGFAAWAALDTAATHDHTRRAAATARGYATALIRPVRFPWEALASLPSEHRGIIERSCFGGLTHPQITRVLNVAPTGA